MLEMQHLELESVAEPVNDLEEPVACEPQICQGLQLHDNRRYGRAAVVFQQQFSELNVLAHLTGTRLDIITRRVQHLERS